MQPVSIPSKIGNLKEIKITDIVKIDDVRVIDRTMGEFDLCKPDDSDVVLYGRVKFDNWTSWVVIQDDKFCPTAYWMWVPDYYYYGLKDDKKGACRYLLYPLDWREFTPKEMKLVQAAKKTYLRTGEPSECYYENNQLVTEIS